MRSPDVRPTGFDAALSGNGWWDFSCCAIYGDSGALVSHQRRRAAVVS
jgi:hypothetical protein